MKTTLFPSHCPHLAKLKNFQGLKDAQPVETGVINSLEEFQLVWYLVLCPLKFCVHMFTYFLLLDNCKET